jgi:hypothetical protein
MRSTNASSVYAYQASELVAVIRSDSPVELDRSRLFNSDESELRAIMRADLVVPNPKAWSAFSGSSRSHEGQGHRQHEGRNRKGAGRERQAVNAYLAASVQR